MIVANLSGGRDSTAMVIRWLELGNDIDYILFCDKVTALIGYTHNEVEKGRVSNLRVKLPHTNI